MMQSLRDVLADHRRRPLRERPYS